MRKFFKVSLVAIVAVAFIFGLPGSTIVLAASPLTVDLGTAAPFAILAGTPLISDAGGTSVITGNVGLSPRTGASIGLLSSQVTGTIYAVDGAGPSGAVNNPALLTLAKNDLTAAYTDAANRTPVTIVPTELGGQHLYPGVYASDSTFLQISAPNHLILDAQGDASAVFIFEASDVEAPALVPGPGSVVELTGSASACNVFWRVNAATIDTTAVFKGTILAADSITVANGANIEGRLLAQTGQVTLINDTVAVPICTASNAAAAAATARAAAATVKLPSTGVASTQNNTPRNVAILAGVLAISALLYFVRRKQKS